MVSSVESEPDFTASASAEHEPPVGTSTSGVPESTSHYDKLSAEVNGGATVSSA